MPSEHTLKAFDAQLAAIRALVVELGALTETQLANAFEAGLHGDLQRATRVIEEEPHADRLEHAIETAVIRVLALQHPMAIDLRETLAALRIANELERICDHAEDIAKRAMTLGPARPGLWPETIGAAALSMLRAVMAAYAASDVAKARDVWRSDRELDQLYTAFVRQLVTYFMEDPRQLSSGMHLLFVARDIERIGDRATNISEMVQFAVTGTRSFEERPKADMTKSLVVPTDRKDAEAGV